MIIKKINSKIKKVSKIYHISDIHIRLLKRHSEYREVFNRLYEYINNTKDENSIICLTGDVVHSKTDMSPECFQMQTELYLNLAKLCPLIIITGNHDCNLNNLSRLDSIEPVIHALNHDNIFYWKDTGLYEFGGITFSVMSVFDKYVDYIRASQFDAEYKIAMFHGPVRSAETDIGYIITEKDMTIDFFTGFDLTLLGDIHKSNQIMNKEGTIGYPGSCIQQNFSENLIHGILVWDIETKKSKFVPIENDYGYFTLDIKDGKITTENWINNIPRKVRLRLVIQNTTPAVIKEIITEVKKATNIIEITRKVDRSNYTVEYENLFSFENLHNAEFQNKLIQQYLELNHELTPLLIDEINLINKKTNESIINSDLSKNLIWNPIRFEFSNMFSYGEDNVINFDNIKDLYGIFSGNTSGKSSIIESLMFCLFDKTPRASKSSHVLNNRKQEFRCKLEFEIGGKSYFIERIGRTLQNGAVRVQVEFWQENEDGEKVILSGQERDDTNKIIRSYIGTYDDFILTSISLQSINDEFITSSQRNRKEILSRMLDIDIFEQLYKIANLDSKELSSKIKLLQKENFEEILSESDIQINKYLNSLEKLQIEKEELDLSISVVNGEINELNKKIRHIDDSDNLELLDEKIKKLKNEHIKLQDKIIKNVELCSQLDISYKKYVDMSSKIDINEIKEKYNRYILLKKEIQIAESEKKSLYKDIQLLQKKISQLDKYKYDPNCDYCVKNPFVIDARNAHNELTILEDKFNANETVLSNIKDELNNLVSIEKKYKMAQEIYNELERIKNSKFSEDKLLEALYREEKLNTENLSSLEEKLIRNAQNIEYIKENELIEKEIQLCINKRKKLEGDTVAINNTIIEHSGKLKVAERNKEIAVNKIEELRALYIEYKAYELYLEATKRDGIPYFLIEKLIPKFQIEVNNILNQLVDFSIMIHMDSENKNIDLYIVYDEEKYWPVELTSGMERFITSLAMRVALNNCSNLPRPNFIIIDEGFGVLDADNLSSIHLLFDFLKSQFNFILCISHLEIMRDIVDGLIEIKKENGFSKVVHEN